MTREISKDDYTEDEIKNLELGKCWCGKPKSEFDNLMRIYCSKDHRSDWYLRTITWSVFKNDVLDVKGKKCKKCGATKDDSKPRYEIALKQWRDEIKSKPNLRELIVQTRLKELEELEEKYQRIMNDDYLIDHEIYYQNRDDVPEKPNDYSFNVTFDVDHIKAVSLGGDMWNKKNLQILCTDCHKVKTKIDMQKLKNQRRGMKPLVKIE